MTSEMLSADKYLSIVHDRGKRGLPLERVYRNMRKKGLFYRAYANLYANEGATTVGSDPEDTIQGMSVERIEKLISSLKDGSFRWGPARRSYVPKEDGSKRTIAIPSWSDKMVQEVMRMILEAYYEPQFRDSSHGFRLNRGCHTALESIKAEWTGSKWFIEGDIRGCFDNIDHNLLLDLLSRNIHDNRFLKLVRGMLKAGYMEDWIYHQTFSGTPQGGVISPLLSNIVLNELDKFVEEELIPVYTKGKRRKRSPEYRRAQDRYYYHKERGNSERAKAERRMMRQLPSRDPYDPGYRRLRYVRYADDFILGFVGKKAEAEEIKQKLSQFLESIKLTLSQEKTEITHARTEKARFLGYDIAVAWSDNRISQSEEGTKGRFLNGTIKLLVPREVKTKWMAKYSYKGKPSPNRQLIRASDYEIVATYGAQLRGLANYYILANNVSKALNQVYHYGMEVCRKTLRTKHGRKGLTRRQSYVKYKYKPKQRENERTHLRVVIQRDGKKPLIAKCGEKPLRTQSTAYLRDELPPYFITRKNSELVRRMLTEKCELCGKDEPLQAHHTNKLKNLRKRWEGRKNPPSWVEWMIRRNRKTIFVCKSCHEDITYGRYDGAKVV